MAKDVIARLKLENQSFNNNAKKSAQEIKNLQGQVSKFDSILGQFGGSIGGVTGKIGGISQSMLGLSGNMGSLIGLSSTATAGIAALGAAVVAGAAEWVNYNIELEKTDQMVSTITGATGEAAAGITDSVRALAGTYNTDIKQTISGVNTLMQQFGITGKEATDLVADGFQGMLEGDQGNMLQMIQQYAPAFRDMGVSASELVAIINNTEGGIFGPEGLAAIQMAGKKIREMSNSVKRDLDALGMDADDVAERLNNGQLNTIDLLKEIASRLGELDPQSQEVGRIMVDVFGRQGSNAGKQMLEAIAELNTNLEETKNQTGEIGASIATVQDATEELNRATRDFLGTEGGWAEYGNEIEAHFYYKVAEAIDGVNSLINSVKSLWNEFNLACLKADQSMRDFVNSGAFDDVMTLIEGLDNQQLSKAISSATGNNKGGVDAVTGESGGGGNGHSWRSNSQTKTYNDNTDKGIRDHIKDLKAQRDEVERNSQEYKNLTSQIDKLQAKLGGSKSGHKGTHTTKKASTISGFDIKTDPDQLEMGTSLEQLRAQESALQKAADATTDMMHRSDLLKQVASIKLRIDSFDSNSAEGVKESIQKWFEDNPPKPLELEVEAKTNNSLKEMKTTATGISGAFSSAASALGNFSSQSKEAAIAAEGMTIASAIATLVGQFAAIPKGGEIWSWIAGTIAGVGTLTAAIASIKSAANGSYAEGGVIAGGAYTGDAVPIMANAGEIVLNYAQQDRLADNLVSGQQGGGYVHSITKGEQLISVINATGKRTGKGEMLFG